MYIGSVSGSPMANQYFDSLLNVAFANEVRLQRLDPADVENFRVDFEDKVKIIGKVKGNAEFFNGKMTGMSKARRYGECQGPAYSYGSKTFNCTIGFDDLKLSYDGKMKYGKMPKVNIKGKATVTPTLVFIEVAQAPNMSPTLKNTMFQQIGQLKPEFTGLGPLNRFTKFLNDGFKSHAQAVIFNSMSQKLQYTLGRAVSTLPLPM